MLDPLGCPTTGTGKRSRGRPSPLPTLSTMSGMHLSREFFELIKAIGESKSKQEEDRIITREVINLKKKLEAGAGAGGAGGGVPASLGKALPGGGGGSGARNALNTNKKKAREFLVRLLYVEMLGHDGSFGYIKAVVCDAMSVCMRAAPLAER